MPQPRAREDLLAVDGATASGIVEGGAAIAPRAAALLGCGMRVTWVLPRDWGIGVGGYAIVYGYANRLSRRGHQVQVLHLDPLPSKPLPGCLRQWRQRLREVPGSDYAPDADVRRRAVPRLTAELVEGDDAVIATAWETASPVVRLGLGSRGFYFIQNYELWSGPQRKVHATWRLPLTRIVIAEWLVDLGRELGAVPVLHLPNAIDPEQYRLVVPVEDRDATRVAMLWHDLPLKRSRQGLAALAAARAQVPGLTAVVFSRISRPHDVPAWVQWHEQATPAEVSDLLNSASIFLNPSSLEGWALPPAEAMSCGCAVVSTDIGGVRDYARAGETALLAPVDDVAGLAAHVVTLVRDQQMRRSLALAGAALMSEQFTWDAAVDRLEEILSGRADAAYVHA